MAERKNRFVYNPGAKEDTYSGTRSTEACHLKCMAMKKDVYVVHDLHYVHDVRLHLRGYACLEGIRAYIPTSSPGVPRVDIQLVRW